jgi:hypothetical protein
MPVAAAEPEEEAAPLIEADEDAEVDEVEDEDDDTPDIVRETEHDL